MSDLFNLDEVYAMAIQIEDNAVEFYRLAAGHNPDNRVVSLLKQMATMEEGHKFTFAQLRRAAAKPADQPDALRPEGALYMAAIMDGYRLEGSSTAAAELTGRETVEQILRLAIELEKRSVLFYLGLRDLAPATALDSIQEIIQEEKQHIATLGQELKARTSARPA